MYTTFTVVGEAASYLKTTYTLIVILVTFLNGNSTATLKKKQPKLPLLVHKKYINFHPYYSRCEKMYNFMHLNVHIPDFLMIRLFCASVVVVAVSIFIAAILDLRLFIAVSKYQINYFPLPRSFYIFDTMFLDTHETKCHKKKFFCI